MASTINAAVGGIVNTADASGELALQASGTTVATLTASGNVGIGGTAAASTKLALSGTAPSSGTLTFGYYQNMALPSTTSAAYLNYTVPSINTGATVTTLAHFYAAQGTFTGASTTQYGFVAESSLTGATNNFGFFSNIASAANRWNFYAAGTARNYFAGGVEDAAGNLRAIPQSGAAKTTSYTLATGDVGEFINVGSGGSVVIPDAVFATGDVVSVFNNTSGNITITCSITTAYIGGTDADKATITLATRGIATILFISGTVCVVNGNVS